MRERERERRGSDRESGMVKEAKNIVPVICRMDDGAKEGREREREREKMKRGRETGREIQREREMGNISLAYSFLPLRSLRRRPRRGWLLLCAGGGRLQRGDRRECEGIRAADTPHRRRAPALN